MLRLSNLRVEGFRSLAKADIPLNNFAILVGRNNAGKSSLLLAIKLLLEGTNRDLSYEDFYRTESGGVDRIVFEADIDGVDDKYLSLCDEKHRKKIAKCVVDGLLRIRRTASCSPLELGKLELWMPDEGVFGTPAGIENAHKQLLPEVIFIEAFKDPKTEAQAKGTATLGKLLKQIVEQVASQISADVANSFGKAERRFNIVQSNGNIQDERPVELKRIEESIKKYVRAVFDNSDVRLKFNLPGVNELLATATVELKDKGPWTAPEGKGQGFQRILYLALLQSLAEELRRHETEISRPFILLYEEPEVFLHPALQRELGDVLENVSHTNQVIIATHSPLLVTPQRIENVIVLRQELASQSHATIPYIPQIDLSSNPADKQLIALLKFGNSSEFLFADYVLIVEGPSDRVLLESCWNKLRRTLCKDSKVVSIIEAGSKSVVTIWVKYLRDMGFIARGVVDLDFLWNGAGTCLKSDKSLSQFCEKFWRLTEEQKISEFNNDGNRTISSNKKNAAFALIVGDTSDKELSDLATFMREQLRNSHNIWVLNQGEIENYFGLTFSSKGKYVETSHKVRNDEINIHSEIEDLLKWFLSDI